MTYRVVTSDKAEDDVDAVLRWFQSQGAVFAGDRWIEGLFRAFEQLEVEPERHAFASEAPDLQRELREIHFGKRSNTYRIVFEIHPHVVRVVRIWHSARDSMTSDDV
jgi:plasmid stabilization system protein ParE